jgi:hypothetical protein
LSEARALAVAEQRVGHAAYADLAREQAATDAMLAEHSNLGERIGKDVAVRELLVHRIEEYARHCGDADLVRECIDGRVDQCRTGLRSGASTSASQQERSRGQPRMGRISIAPIQAPQSS